MTQDNSNTPKLAFQSLIRLLNDQRGATAIEYGLLIALIAVVIMQALITLGETTGQTILTVDEAMSGEETVKSISLSGAGS